MTSHHLRVERPSDGVALLVLDNPDQRNAMSDAMTEAWSAAVADLAGDPTVRAVVVTGEGSAFCSGGDTSWIASEPDATVDDLRRRMLPFYRAWLAIRSLEVPTIAAVNGAAIGAGLCLALACDIRYAADLRPPRRPVREARHAPRHGGHLVAARGGRSRSRPRPPAHRPPRRRRRGAPAGSGLPGHRRRDVPRRGARRGRRGGRHRADRHAGSPSSRSPTAATRRTTPPCSGRRSPSP